MAGSRESQSSSSNAPPLNDAAATYEDLLLKKLNRLFVKSSERSEDIVERTLGLRQRKNAVDLTKNDGKASHEAIAQAREAQRIREEAKAQEEFFKRVEDSIEKYREQLKINREAMKIVQEDILTEVNQLSLKQEEFRGKFQAGILNTILEVNATASSFHALENKIADLKSAASTEENAILDEFLTAIKDAYKHTATIIEEGLEANINAAMDKAVEKIAVQSGKFKPNNKVLYRILLGLGFAALVLELAYAYFVTDQSKEAIANIIAKSSEQAHNIFSTLPSISADGSWAKFMYIPAALLAFGDLVANLLFVDPIAEAQAADRGLADGLRVGFKTFIKNSFGSTKSIVLAGIPTLAQIVAYSVGAYADVAALDSLLESWFGNGKYAAEALVLILGSYYYWISQRNDSLEGAKFFVNEGKYAKTPSQPWLLSRFLDGDWATSLQVGFEGLSAAGLRAIGFGFLGKWFVENVMKTASVDSVEKLAEHVASMSPDAMQALVAQTMDAMGLETLKSVGFYVGFITCLIGFIRYHKSYNKYFNDAKGNRLDQVTPEERDEKYAEVYKTMGWGQYIGGIAKDFFNPFSLGQTIGVGYLASLGANHLPELVHPAVMPSVLGALGAVAAFGTYRTASLRVDLNKMVVQDKLQHDIKSNNAASIVAEKKKITPQENSGLFASAVAAVTTVTRVVSGVPGFTKSLPFIPEGGAILAGASLGAATNANNYVYFKDNVMQAIGTWKGRVSGWFSKKVEDNNQPDDAVADKKAYQAAKRGCCGFFSRNSAPKQDETSSLLIDNSSPSI